MQCGRSVSPGRLNAFTATDLTVMNVIGWNVPSSFMTVGSGQTVYVMSGVTSSGVIVLNGGMIEVEAGGIASGTIVNGGI